MAQERRLGWFVGGMLMFLVLLLIVYHSMLLPIFLSLVFAYFTLPFAEWVHLKFRLPRSISSLVVTTFFFGLLLFGVVRILPILYREAVAIGELAPAAIRFAIDTVVPAAESFLEGFSIVKPGQLRNELRDLNLARELGNRGTAALQQIWEATPTLLGQVFEIVLIPLLSFFVLRDYVAMKAGLLKVVPSDLLPPLRLVLYRINDTLSAVIKGHAIVAFILTGFYIAGFSLIGLPSAVSIGLITGICRIVPYMDVLVGGVLSLILIFNNFTSWMQVVWVAATFVVVQSIDGMLITPRVIGHRVGLHPAVVIVSILAFGNWFGFWGVLLAIPTVAVSRLIIEIGIAWYLQSAFYGASAQALTTALSQTGQRIRKPKVKKSSESNG